MKWFVIKENEHIGPYAEEDIKNLYAQGKINKVSFLWKEGMDEPRSYKSLFIDEEKVNPPAMEDDLPPPLPPEVAPPQPKEAPPIELPKTEQASQSGVSRSGTEEILEVPPEPVEPLEESPVIEEEALEEKPIRRKRALFPKVIALLMITLIGAGTYYFYGAKDSKSFARPSKMGVRDYKRLMKGVVFNKITAGISKDKTTIFVSVGANLEGPVQLRIKSFDGQVLTVDPVVASSKGTLKDHLVEFKEFNFEKGQRLAEGWYEFELKSMGELERPFNLFGSDGAKVIDFKTKALLTTKTVPAFNKALSAFNEKNSDSSRQFWEELIQKYQTMKAMALKIERDMKSVFESDSSNWNSTIDAFEASYTQSHGKLFTAFVIQNEKAYEDIKKQDFDDNIEVIANYTRLTKLAKSVGLETMNALDILREVKDPSNGAARVEAEQKIKKLYDNIHETISESVKELEARL